MFTSYYIFLLLLVTTTVASAQAPTSISLKETGPGQKRDLSVPGSRMVINPFNFRLLSSATASSYSNSPAMPLNVGYLHTGFTNRDVENLLGVYHVKGSNGPAELPGWVGSLTDTAAWKVESQAHITPVSNGLKLTVDANASPVWKRMETSVITNIDASAVLKVTVSGATGTWSLKLVANDGAEVKVLQPDTNGTGSFTFNLQALTGWSGTRQFGVQFYSIGQSSSVTVNDLRINYRNTPLSTSWTGNMNSTADWVNPDNGAGASWSANSNGLTFNVTSGFHYFKTKNKITVNVDESPTLKIVVPAATGLWSVKVDDGAGDIALRQDGEGSGVFYLNVPAATGWTGTKTFDIKIYAISYGQPATVTISEIGATNSFSMTTSWRGNVTNPAQWIKANAQSTIEQTSSGMRFSVAAATTTVSFRTASSITVDVDKTPLLVLNIPEASGMWSMKVNDGSGDIALQQDNRNFGSFEYDLRALTGWSGVKTFNIVFYAIPYNVHPAYVTVGDIRIVGSGGTPFIVKASSYTTEWTPHDLPFTAAYIDSASLSGYDYFYDEYSLVRNITFGNTSAGNNKYIIGGSYAGDISYSGGAVQITREFYSYAIKSAAFNGHPIKYYTTATEMQMGGASLATPPPCGFWAIEIEAGALSGNLLSIVTAFAGNNDVTSLPGYLNAPLTGSNAVNGHATRQQFWDNFLTKVPRPSRFDIQAVDAKGVTPQQVAHAYYTAFVFIGSSVLAADPGVFNYPQVACKASLWDEGAPQAPFSASWDSFTAMQLYGYIDPALSWEAFKGVMSLTTPEGVIAGESLPSRKAQTAWQLFQVNKDTASLAAVYAPLSRYLNWRMKYPYWIYYTQQDTIQKDAEFVFSALVDLAYMREISKVVMNEDSAAAWEQKRINFYQKAKPWFWATPSAKPVQYYNTSTNGRAQGNVSWVTTGLYTDLLTGDQLTGMNNLFDDNFSSSYNFYLAGVAKYPDLSYTIYGLINRGNKTAAATMVDAAIRETVLSGMFSEVTSNTGPAYPEGVRPSPFSACTIIDFVWLKNGFDYDKGYPHVVNIFDGARGVSNIDFGGRMLDFTANNGHFSFTGSYLNQPTSLILDTALVAPVPLGAPEEQAAAVHPGSHLPLLVSWLKLYPNPLRDYVNVSFYLNKTEYVLLRIFDQFGRTRATRYERLPQGSHNVVFDTKRYAPGVYYCNLVTNRERKSEKFIKLP